MWKNHPIPRSLVIEGLYTAFSQRLEPGYVFRGETHDFAELVLVKTGRIGVTAGSESFELSAGGAVYHPPMEFHSLCNAASTESEIFVFTFGTSRSPIFSPRVFSFTQEHLARAEGVLALLREATGKKAGNAAATILPGKENTAQCAVLELEELLLTLTPASGKPTTGEGSAGLRNYRRALSVMSEKLNEPLDTRELAALCRISPSLLKKLFSRYAGVGVMEYFRQCKINAAIPLLREGASVREVAERFGFPDAGYFSTVFRRVTGHTPTYYRTH